MVSFEAHDSELPQSPVGLKAPMRMKFAGENWSLVDVKRATCLAGEGELPFVAPPGVKRLGADFTGGSGAFATIEFYDDEPPRLYVGGYAEFDDLKFTNLRPVPGWSAETPQIRHQTNALNCPGCGAAVALRAAGQTMSAVCGAIIDTADNNFRIIQDADEKVKKLRFVLPIGVRGALLGTQYEVIGVAQRKDEYVSWIEYLLFNPWRGFRWLVTYNGHWSFVTRVPQLGNLSGKAVRFDGRTFKLYAQGRARVTAVLGEFYWKVARGESAHLEDYIAPPQILSKEVYSGLNEFTWSRGEYLPHKAVAEAFKINDLAAPTGIYLNQPNPYAAKLGPVWRRALLFFAAFLAIQFFFASCSKRRQVFAADYFFQRDDSPKTLTTPTFQIDGRQGPVRIEAQSPVNNQWIGFDFDLVNAKTNETFSAPLTVEYYYGTDGGESWSEGDQTNDVTIPAVPPGEYFLNIETAADPALAQAPWHLAVKRGGLFWSNFFLGLIVLLAYPLWVWFRRNAFEVSRWSESDYSPYKSSDD
jgi:hypothetical protein